jgi:pimeloyl-ACP methyl ester carboxylesterase
MHGDLRLPPDQFVTLNGIKFNYLDWGGTGTPIVLLAGMGCTPHNFIEFAPALTDHFHVLGFSRRSHGLSEFTAEGNDISTGADDLHLFLDAIGIKRAHLVGHSMGGGEISMFAARYPDRVLRLVYLDGAYDWGTRPKDPPDPAEPDIPDDFPSYDAYIEFWQTAVPYIKQWWGPAFQEMFRMQATVYADGRVAENIPMEAQASFAASRRAYYHPYQEIHAPALGIYGVPQHHQFLRDSLSDEEKTKANEYWQQVMMPWRIANIERFKSDLVGSQVLALQNATHYCFIDRRDEVLQAMREFLLS